MPKVLNPDGTRLKLHYIHIKVTDPQKKFLDALRKKTGITTSRHLRIMLQREMSVMKEV